MYPSSLEHGKTPVETARIFGYGVSGVWKYLCDSIWHPDTPLPRKKAADSMCRYACRGRPRKSRPSNGQCATSLIRPVIFAMCWGRASLERISSLPLCVWSEVRISHLRSPCSQPST
ncbi:hypothetical protein BDW72DRAFT_144345 [Aspergillus terricola var. indicus]